MEFEAARAPEQARGELSLRIDGGEMGLRPSFEAITAFERETGKGLLLLAREALSGSLTLGETAQIACQCIRAWGRDTGSIGAKGARADRIAELILESDGGIREALATVAGLLSLAATGGYSAKGEAKAATMETGTPPDAA
ncbi:MAG: GTA-gp10 family protein [Sphingobium sp.]|uniref:GTA-gp10 family protein n=1 Tax=Sphingobium sp. TaxID=1912891 RepID=UPI0029BEB79A|nr:GTA-gp10 family protein [Sphingobium sp.]MDX3908423.1 GTA-gp10 family protein [Sphingobium sp.]